MLREDNPYNLQQLIRLPGQQYDDESGLHYNRHRYYNPGQGRYITQDPIGLKGGRNLYQYPVNPIQYIDPLGLETLKCVKPLHSMGGTGEKSGPDIWGNPFYHQYVCVPDGADGHKCGGQDQRGEVFGDGMWGPGKAMIQLKVPEIVSKLSQIISASNLVLKKKLQDLGLAIQYSQIFFPFFVQECSRTAKIGLMIHLMIAE